MEKTNVKANIAYDDLREWLAYAERLSEVRNVLGASWQEDIGLAAEAVLRAPANASRLQAEGIDDIGSLIRAYLIEGKPAFRMRATPTVGQAVEAIHEAGGVAIWAHPFWDLDDPAEALAAIDRFRACGLDGVECFYVTHDAPQTQLLADRCAEQHIPFVLGHALHMKAITR